MKVDPYALQMACALIFIAICVGIAALWHDHHHEKKHNRRRGPWG